MLRMLFMILVAALFGRKGFTPFSKRYYNLTSFLESLGVPARK